MGNLFPPRLPALFGLLFLLFWMIAPAGGGAPQREKAESLRLTPAARAWLQALPALHGPALASGGLDGKVVAVTFFASWCPPCRVEMAHLKKIYPAFRARGFEVVAINLFEDFDDLSDSKRLAGFLRKTNPGFPVVKGDDAISRFFGNIRRIPTLFVFDRAGGPALRFSNERTGASTTFDPAELEALIERLLAPAPS